MGKKKKKKKKKLEEEKKDHKKSGPREEVLSFGKKNLSIFGAALLSIVVGFLLLSRGSLTTAPILLVLGYIVLIPLSIVIK